MGLSAGTSPAVRSRNRWIGPLCAVVGVFGFSFKAILIKLAYKTYPVDAVTLLTLRMLYSEPLFCLMAWWASRAPATAPIVRRDWMRLVWLGFIGYYLASLLDFAGLQYITASLERLVLYLYPTFVMILSALLLRKPVTRRALIALALSYAGIALVFRHDVRIGGDMASTLTGGALVLGSALFYALYLVQAGAIIHRLGSLALQHGRCSARRHSCSCNSRSRSHGRRSMCRPRSTGFALPWPSYPRRCPWLIAESVRRLGANAASLVGAMGPVFTIGLGAMILGESIHAMQLAGAALVLTGVLLVTLRARADETASAV